MRSPIIALIVLVAAGTLSACSTPAKPLAIALVESSDRPATIHVTGMSSAELRALAATAWSPDQWRELMTVTVNDAVEPLPIAGGYTIRDEALVFEPRFPLDHGRTYEVRVNSAKLPAPREDASIARALVTVKADPEIEPATVSEIQPAGEIWPENLLRFYIYFSQPMARTTAPDLVHIVDERGVEVQEALLSSELDFWNDDQTRYTVFFEPGRVKRGIQPNRDQGRALVRGQRYAVVVDREWKDAKGRLLRAQFRRPFIAGPAIEQGLSMADWQLVTPKSATRDPLVVKFPWTLDHALLQRAMSIELDRRPVEGTVSVSADGKEWRFAPAAPWASGGYELRALSILEDPSGNRVGRPFELPTRPDAERTSVEPEDHRRAFEVR